MEKGEGGREGGRWGERGGRERGGRGGVERGGRRAVTRNNITVHLQQWLKINAAKSVA